MNKGRYRLVFSEEKGTYVPVPEETKACGKGGGARALRRMVAALAAALPGLVIANPGGHQIIHGQVGVQQQGSTLNITASDRAVINWQQFSIQPGETTRFIQPSSTASVLNRVVGQDPSKILGNLIANGRVFLINPNGVLFGAGAKVDTAGLVASTLNIKTEDFLAGTDEIRRRRRGRQAAQRRHAQNHGRTADPHRDRRRKHRHHHGGKWRHRARCRQERRDRRSASALAAGEDRSRRPGHQPRPADRQRRQCRHVRRGADAGWQDQRNRRTCRDGRAHRAARIEVRHADSSIRNEGSGGGRYRRAGRHQCARGKGRSGAQVDASGTRGGSIAIEPCTAPRSKARCAPPAAARRSRNGARHGHIRWRAGPRTAGHGSGPGDKVSAAPPADAGKGGQIVVTAETVVLDGEATLDASGDSGGGSVLAGGDWQGANAGVRNAQITWVGPKVSLLADALLEGDGGKVVVWADQATAFAGNIWARGGSEGGNGGEVEVSGKLALLYRGRTDTSAARGRNGMLLLDPLAIVIQGGSGDGSNDGSQLFSGGTTPGTITAGALGPTVIFESEIEEQSKTTDIILRALRSVTVGASSFNYTGSGNLAGETAGALALATGSSLLIETRNLGGEEGGPSAGIDLVTGGAHGANLRIITQGAGNITMQTGYSNGTAVGDQRADIIVPVLTAGEGNILLRTVRGTGSTIQFRNTVTTEGVLQTAADSHTGAQRLQGTAGVAIDGDYTLDNGTLDIDGTTAAISGMLYLSGTLDGSAPLTLGGLVWYSGVMTGTGAVTLTGAGELPPNFNYRYLDRRLNIAGSLDLKNNLQLYIRNGGTLHLASTGTLQSTTHDGNIYFNSGSSGTAVFSADAGAQVNVAAGRQISLYSDNNVGNQISAVFATSGAGTLALDQRPLHSDR
jgi:filamentous hemagglutinin family protein